MAEVRDTSDGAYTEIDPGKNVVNTADGALVEIDPGQNVYATATGALVELIIPSMIRVTSAGLLIDVNNNIAVIANVYEYVEEWWDPLFTTTNPDLGELVVFGNLIVR